MDAVVEAISKKGELLPYDFWSESSAKAEVVPMAMKFVAELKYSLVLSPAKAVPLANWIAPVPPAAAAAAEVIQEPFTEKQPPVISHPAVPVEVAVVLSRVAEMPPAKVLVPCPAPTVMADAKVEVAVPVAAILFTLAVFAANVAV